MSLLTCKHFSRNQIIELHFKSVRIGYSHRFVCLYRVERTLRGCCVRSRLEQLSDLSRSPRDRSVFLNRSLLSSLSLSSPLLLSLSLSLSSSLRFSTLDKGLETAGSSVQLNCSKTRNARENRMGIASLSAGSCLVPAEVETRSTGSCFLLSLSRSLPFSLAVQTRKKRRWRRSDEREGRRILPPRREEATRRRRKTKKKIGTPVTKLAQVFIARPRTCSRDLVRESHVYESILFCSKVAQPRTRPRHFGSSPARTRLLPSTSWCDATACVKPRR